MLERMRRLTSRLSVGLVGVLVLGTACSREPPLRETRANESDPHHRARMRMVTDQVEARGVVDPAVLAALRRVPRHRFVPAEYASEAYDDHPLSIGLGQTISQPYVVAFMTAALELDGDESVLEIGTGSGYQAAVLAELVPFVHTIEIVPELAEGARQVLAELGYDNVEVRTGDGYVGWPEAAPFDAILVTAAPDHVPPALVEQLAVGGRMILPVGDRRQELRLLTRTAQGVREESVLPVRFVPMTGRAQQRD